MTKYSKTLSYIMELNSTFSRTWKLFIIGSLLGFLILILNLTENNQNNVGHLSTAKTPNNFLEFTPLVQPNSLNPSEFITITSSPPPLASITTTTYSSELSNFNSSSPPPKQPSIVDQPSELSNSNNNLSAPPIVSSISSQPPIGSVVVKSANNLTNYYATEKSQENYNISYVDDNLVNAKKNNVEKKCNMFDGKWVYKQDANPAYRLWQCPFIEEKMGCQSNGRPDFDYEKWSWEAKDCDIPLLNGTDMVERFRNKRVVLVGDSLNRNMWESLSCILYSSLPNASSIAKVRSQSAHVKTFFRVKEEYNFTVEFFWSPFLVQLNETHESGKKVLVLDKLSPNSELWPGGDIMIFNSGHWWTQLGKNKAWEMFEYQGKLIKKMPLLIAYKRAMNTWAKWVEKNVDPSKTTLFFRSVSAEHLDKQRDQWCHTKTKPIMDESYKPFFPKPLIRSVEDVLKRMSKIQVRYLNVTKMSEYRIDAHPSIYRFKDWKIRAEKDMQSLLGTADCGHWCLPGLPDTWNRLLYASLVLDDSRDV